MEYLVAGGIIWNQEECCMKIWIGCQRWTKGSGRGPGGLTPMLTRLGPGSSSSPSLPPTTSMYLSLYLSTTTFPWWHNLNLNPSNQSCKFGLDQTSLALIIDSPNQVIVVQVNFISVSNRPTHRICLKCKKY